MINKGSDKNVGSIEEDIRILQEKDCMWHYPETRIEEAIENIIADYTRQKQINEEHQKINGELREKVKELEEENLIQRKQIMSIFDRGYISKQVVKEGLEDIEDYFDRLNGPDEDIEYIKQIKQELLGGGK